MPTSNTDLIEEIGSSYVLALIAAKRAKQLREGAPQLVECDSNHSLTIALEEIAQHKIRPVMPQDKAAAEALATPEEESLLSLDASLALPALDEEVEAATTTDLASLLGDEEEETEREEEEEVTAGISALVGDDDDAEVESGDGEILEGMGIEEVGTDEVIEPADLVMDDEEGEEPEEEGGEADAVEDE